MTDLLDRRLTEAGRRWQAEQPPPPAVPLERLVAPSPRPVRWHTVAAAAVTVLVVGAGAVAVVRHVGGNGSEPAARPSGPRTVYVQPLPVHAVPWAELAPHHPHYPHVHGRPVTPYDDVFSSGRIAGTAHPGDTLVFTVRLESSTDLPLVPCPDFGIAFGRGHGYTGQLNCAQVPDRDRQDRPYLPANKQVPFEMHVQVPDEPGRQKVLWTLSGPFSLPGFYGIVRVEPR